MYDEQKIEQVREGKACISYNEKEDSKKEFRALVYFIFPNDATVPKGSKPFYKKGSNCTSSWTGSSKPLPIIYSINDFKTNTKMKVELELEKLKEAYSKANVSQKTLLKNLYPKEVEEIDKFDGLLSATEISSEIWPRNDGEYINKGYYLSIDFQWEIVKDQNGINVLIAKRK